MGVKDKIKIWKIPLREQTRFESVGAVKGHGSIPLSSSKKGVMMRLIAIGDIHGELDHLERLIERLAPTREDTIVFLGDYVDRGTKIPETVSYLIEFGKKFPNTVFLKGNHEEMLLDSRNKMTQLWYANGGDKTAKQYNAKAGLFDEHMWFFESLKEKHRVYYEKAYYYFSHAGWDPYISLEKQYENPDPEILLWSREHLTPFGVQLSYDNWTDGYAVFGHTPRAEPFVYPHMVGIDTGAVFGNYLTAVILGEEWELYDSREGIPVSEGLGQTDGNDGESTGTE